MEYNGVNRGVTIEELQWLISHLSEAAMVMTAAIVLKQAWKTDGPMRPRAFTALSLAVPVDS